MAEQIEVRPITATSPMLQIAGEISHKKVEIDGAENTQREMKRKLRSAKGNRTAGAAALLIGLILFLLLGGVLSALGIFLAIIGGLTLLRSMVKQNNTQSQLKAHETQLAETRRILAELSAQLAVM